MPATLKNISNAPVTVILDHAAFLNTKDGWRRSTAKFANMSEEGARTTREVRRSYPGALTIRPGEEVADLHPAIAKCAQVPGLIKSKILSLTLQDDPTPAKSEPEPTEAPQSEKQSRKGKHASASTPDEDKEIAR